MMDESVSMALPPSPSSSVVVLEAGPNNPNKNKMEANNHVVDTAKVMEEGELVDDDEDDINISEGMDHICVSAPQPQQQAQVVPTGLMVNNSTIRYASYESEGQMPSIMRLIQKDLSEPYSVYTYRYFIHNWPKLCFLAHDEAEGDRMIGAIVCKLDVHKQMHRRGYIAMLAVDERYRRKKIGSNLVLQSIKAMMAAEADEIVLETEITNKSALRLYENLGFVRDKRLFRYYLNGVDALRLKLWLK